MQGVDFEKRGVDVLSTYCRILRHDSVWYRRWNLSEEQF